MGGFSECRRENRSGGKKKGVLWRAADQKERGKMTQGVG